MTDRDRLQGSCHCGAVKLSVPATSFGIVACHCQDCQKLHGNFFAMIAAERDAVQLDGDASMQRYASSATVVRAFCRACGSRLFKDVQGSPRLLLAAGLFGRHTGMRLRKQVWDASKPDWYDLPAIDAPGTP
jgi:hypothetical protein